MWRVLSILPEPAPSIRYSDIKGKTSSVRPVTPNFVTNYGTDT